MGRPRKPTNLRILQGNPGKIPINPNEPKPKIGAPPPPDFLAGYALEEWHRITPILESLGLLSELDTMALAAYCQCYERWRTAEDSIKTEGMTTTTEKGNVIQSPHVSIANKAMLNMHKFLVQFGMSPASRAGVTATKREPDSPLAKFKKKR